MGHVALAAPPASPAHGATASLVGGAVLALALSASSPAQAQGRKPAAAGKPAPASAAPTSGSRPLAQTLTGDAKAAYDAAKLLVGDGDFGNAAIKFRAAFDASHDPRLLWNIAACEKNQRHYAKTIALLHEYLDTGGDLLTDADRREARGVLDAIESFTVHLTVTVSEPGAEVFVDDERVGTSPLASPVTVDIGQRKVTARKPGFKEATEQVALGGSAAGKVSLTMSADVHQGHLKVTTQSWAHISLDGKRVGNGAWEGDVPSGGHTLRVESAGMRPYQSEVVVADDESRTIDVPLEKEGSESGGGAHEPEASPPGFEVGVSGGPGIKMHGDQPWVTTVRADIALRAAWVVGLGLYAEYGAIDASGACGTDSHGPSPTQPLDLAVRSSFQACRWAKAGLQLTVHFLPAHAFDPWIAFEPGARLTFFDFAAFEPLTGRTSYQSASLPALDIGGRAGLDWHPVASFRPWSIGAYGALVYTALADEAPARNAGNDGTAPPALHDGGITAVQYFSVFFGLRSSLAF
jgi:hypothetical protein